MTRRLAREEGLLVGGSCGMAVVAALQRGREADQGRRRRRPAARRRPRLPEQDLQRQVDGRLRLPRRRRGRDGRRGAARQVRRDPDAGAHPPERDRPRGDRHPPRVRRQPAARRPRRAAGDRRRGGRARSTRRRCSTPCSPARRPSSDRVERHMSPPLPIIGSGEAVGAAVAALGDADALAGPRRRQAGRRRHPAGRAGSPGGHRAYGRAHDRPLAGFNTRAIHAGQEPDPATGAVIVPMHLTTTYKQDGVGGLRGGYEYSRSGNPTRTALHEALAALEEGTTALAFASGLAAEDTLLRTVCRPGDHVVLGGDAYGGTFRLISRVLSEWGLEYTPVHLDDPDAGAGGDAADDPGDLVRDAEQPAAQHHRHRGHRGGRARGRRAARRRQHLRLALPAAAADAGRGRRRPLDDEVPRRALRRGRRRARHRATPSSASGWPTTTTRWARSPAPFDSWLVLRSLKTLGVRMDRHSANAARVAEFLLGHPAVAVGALPGPARRTPGTTSRPSRCPASAGWSRSGSGTARTPR